MSGKPDEDGIEKNDVEIFMLVTLKRQYNYDNVLDIIDEEL